MRLLRRARGGLVATAAILACGLCATSAAQANLLSTPLSNWLWSTPMPQGNSLNDVAFIGEDGGRTWTPEALPLGIGAVTAHGKIAYAAQKTGGEIFVARGSGLAGVPSRITLAISGPATRTAASLEQAHGYVTVHGQLTPALANVTIHVSWHTEGEWVSEDTRTDDHGAFSVTPQEVEQTITFLADWDGDGTYRGVSTAPVRLTVR
jgi:hypothetical protein